MRTIAGGLLLLCLMSTACGAESPEDAVRAFTLAIQADGVPATVTRFTHPDEAARFKRILMPRIRETISARDPGFVKEVLGQEMSLANIEPMPPSDFLENYLKSRGMLVDGSKFEPPQFLGSGREGDVVHLIVRTELTALNGVRIKRMDVISLKPLGETWKFMLSSEMEQQALTLAAQ